MRQQPDEHPCEPDPLDRLLADARWDELSPEVLNRLRSRWRSLMAERRQTTVLKSLPARAPLAWRKRVLTPFALAATVAFLLLSVGLACWLQSGRRAGEPPSNLAMQPSTQPAPVANKPRCDSAQPLVRDHAKAQSALVAPTGTARNTTARPRRQASRPPNAYELVIVAAHRRNRRESRLPAATDEQAADNRQSETGEGPFAHRRSERSEESLGGGEIVCFDQDDRNAFAAKSGSVATNLPSALSEGIGALLAQGDSRSVEAFLERVEDPPTSAEALDCLARSPSPPTQLLFECLRSRSAGRRMAAARALGSLNQAAISTELIAMVERGLYRREAMIALLSSSEETARQFLADAERNPMLAATLWNARLQFETSLSRRS